jgi:hypothetical protein
VNDLVVQTESLTFFSRQTEGYHRARLLPAASEHSGDWHHALPITAWNFRIDNEAIRAAVGLRLARALNQSHQCFYGSLADGRGIHGLFCRPSAGRQSRHQ